MDGTQSHRVTETQCTQQCSEWFRGEEKERSRQRRNPVSVRCVGWRIQQAVEATVTLTWKQAVAARTTGVNAAHNATATAALIAHTRIQRHTASCRAVSGVALMVHLERSHPRLHFTHPLRACTPTINRINHMILHLITHSSNITPQSSHSVTVWGDIGTQSARKALSPNQSPMRNSSWGGKSVMNIATAAKRFLCREKETFANAEVFVDETVAQFFAATGTSQRCVAPTHTSLLHVSCSSPVSSRPTQLLQTLCGG